MRLTAVWRPAVAVAMAVGLAAAALARDVVVRPREIDDVLVNPGIGFTTFGRFGGDPLSDGSPATDYPACSVAYFRIYWQALEPEQGRYRWEVIDELLAAARAHGQSLMLRVAPYATTHSDVPPWYRALVGDDYRKLPIKKWRTDPEDPRYAEHYGKLIRALAERYDGHPDLESVDLGIVGAWGEGAGANRLRDATMQALVDSYTDSFARTPLVALLMDSRTHRYAASRRAVGWRADCLGDMGGFQKSWSHMQDRYPQAVASYGLAEAWKAAPVNFEVCWVMQHWHEKQWDIDYIVDQSLKWHASSVNAKSSPVPHEWWPAVQRWLKNLGYRFVLRKFSYPASIRVGQLLPFSSWWENKGVAPCYKAFPLALKLTGPEESRVYRTAADIRTWQPGDVVCDGQLDLADLPAGEYRLSIAIVDAATDEPKVKLAIAGVEPDGWYPLGKLRIGAE